MEFRLDMDLSGDNGGITDDLDQAPAILGCIWELSGSVMGQTLLGKMPPPSMLATLSKGLVPFSPEWFLQFSLKLLLWEVPGRRGCWYKLMVSRVLKSVHDVTRGGIGEFTLASFAAFPAEEEEDSVLQLSDLVISLLELHSSHGKRILQRLGLTVLWKNNKRNV